MTENNFFQESAHDASFSNLMQCSDLLEKTGTPIFSIDGNFEKNAEAVKFLNEFDFVIVEQAPNSSFLQNCIHLKQSNLAGHEAFAFLFQKSTSGDQKEKYFQENIEAQLIELLEKEMSDFIPDATAHSQEAWNLRCDLVLRKFFATLYDCKRDCADELLPSIESLIHCDAKDAKNVFEAPTVNYNPTWSRAPHVISAYHLHAHHETLQTFYADYMQQSQTKSLIEIMRNKQRWLQRTQKECIATAKKVILGKRATSQMVQDAAFHAKKSSCTNESSDSCVEAMRPLQGGYEAFILIAAEKESVSMDLIPGFSHYYSYYLACRRNKWACMNADGFTISLEDEYSKTIFERCHLKISLRPGCTLILARTTPRWMATPQKCSFLPVSYRWQNKSTILVAKDVENDDDLTKFSQICPFELALNATYQASIKDGVVYTSLPHLTGAAQQFSRSTKKTSASLKIQRLEIYNRWLKSLAKKSDSTLAHYHYRMPKLPSYLLKLITFETENLKNAQIFTQNVANSLMLAEKAAEEEKEYSNNCLSVSAKKRKINSVTAEKKKNQYDSEECLGHSSSENVQQEGDIDILKEKNFESLLTKNNPVQNELFFENLIYSPVDSSIFCKSLFNESINQESIFDPSSSQELIFDQSMYKESSDDQLIYEGFTREPISLPQQDFGLWES